MRIKDLKLLESYRGIPCAVCGSLVTCAHHIKSKGSGGHDVESNLMALCQQHHNEVHQYGLRLFVDKYPQVEHVLKSKGWEQTAAGKWLFF